MRELELNVDHLLQVSQHEMIKVTLFDANHCPGAVMFLFEGTKFGRILHTGHFRYAGPMLYDMAFIEKCKQPNVLYIDNTFLDPRCSFPSREEAMSMMLRIIHENEDAKVMIGLSIFGKEHMLVALARSLNQPIGVDENR